MKYLSMIAVLIVISFSAHSQAADYRVVFDMTSKDSMNQQSLIRELELIKEGNPNAKLEVVVYAHGLDLVVKDRSPHQAAIAKLLESKDVSFKVCSMTMKRNNLDKSRLIPGVEVVPDGIYEIISKQRDGWGYIKVGR